VSDDDITLGTLFSVSRDDAAKAILEAAGDEFWSGLRLPERVRRAAAGKIAGHVNALLEVPVADVLGRAWSTLQEVRERADAAKAGEDSPVPLARHTIESEQVPRIELRIDGKPSGQLEFPVKLTLEFEAGVVVIRDQGIRAIRPGLGKVTGTVSCESITIKQLGPETLTLPGELVLARPIPIPRRERAGPPAT
jgi:hypothetical protein